MQTRPRPATTLPAAGRAGAIRAALLAAVGTVALAGCGLVPPVPVDDPLGLDGKTAAVSLGSASLTAAFAPAAVDGSGEVSVTFDDADWPDVPLSPGRLTNELSIATATLDAGEAEAPETIELSDIDVEVTLWQGAATYEAAAPDSRAAAKVDGAGPITLVRGACDADSCTYSYEGSVPAFGEVTFSGDAVANAVKVITQAPQPNHVRAVVTLRADPDTLDGRTLTIEFDAATGSVAL